MGLLIAAVITTVLAIAAIGGLIWWTAGCEHRHALVLALIVAVPLQPLAYYVIRVPLLGFLTPEWPMPNWLRILALLLLAPLTEEPAKWLPLAIPGIRRVLSPGNAVPMALSVGLGFGIGEAWFLAQAISHAPGYAALPFWMFSGFAIERLEVCLLHGAFAALPYVLLVRNRLFWLGALLAVGLHFLLNFPIYLAGIDLFGVGRPAWLALLQAWTLAFVVVCAFMVWRLNRWSRTKIA